MELKARGRVLTENKYFQDQSTEKRSRSPVDEKVVLGIEVQLNKCGGKKCGALEAFIRKGIFCAK